MIGQVIGHYRILEKLGAGGMGEVYRAEDLTLKRHVAFKVLPPEVADSPEKLERFHREAETLGALDHPNIVKVLRYFEANGTAYFLMPYYQGQALHHLLESDGVLKREDARSLMLALMDALEHIHQHFVGLLQYGWIKDQV